METEVIFILMLIASTIAIIILSFFHVEPENYANIEWRFPLSPTVSGGHFIATGQQQGIRAKVYGPGWHFVFLIQLFGKITEEEIPEVPAGKLGMVFARDGRTLPFGQIIAPEHVECDDFTDGEKFLLSGGWQGYQLRLRPPGKVIMNEELFELTFIDPPVISTREEIFKNPAGETQTRIRSEMAIITALIGEEIPEEQMRSRIVAKAPAFEDEEFPSGHSNFQDSVAFIEGGGQRGIQEEIVGPMRWGGNPQAFKLEIALAPFVPPGSVGVVISNVGKEPEENEKEYIGANKEGKSVYTLKEGVEDKRGILAKTKGPGDHFLHPLVRRLITVDTTWRSVLLDGSKEEFATVNVVTEDGFTVPMQAELVFRIPPGNAPKVIAIAGSPEGLEEDILAPFVDDISKRIVSKKAIPSLFKEREALRKEIQETLKEALEDEYFIEVSSFRIIKLDFEGSPDAEVRTFANLLARVANAAQEQLTITAEMEVQRKRITLEKQKGIADGAYVREVGKELVKVAAKLPESAITQAVGMLSASHGNIPDAIANFLNSFGAKQKQS